MRKIYFISIILFLCLGCSEQHKIEKRANALRKCEDAWQYFKLDKPIKGIVLLHTKGYCGYIYAHANTIIIVNDKDTIRVVGPCNTANVQVADSVIVYPDDSDTSKGTFGDTKYDCRVQKTCHGIVSKLK